MTNEMTVLEIIERTHKRRDERRAFLRMAGGATALVGGLSLLAACDDDDSPAPAPTPSASASPTGVATDPDVLNFALNLEYLEAQFYSYAAFGSGLNASQLTGSGTPGAVVTTAGTSGTGVPRQVAFATPLIAEYAREIAIDEIAHVAFLRQALGSSAVAQPAINISGGTGSAFAAAATAAGVPGGSTFDPYANENNFLLGAYIFEDVGVTAYKGAAPLLTNKTFLEASAGILAAEAYHAGLLRTVLYNRGVTVADLRTGADLISNARDSLDGATDLDQGITGTATVSNIVPADSNAIAFSRSPGQVLNIVYLNKLSVNSGGFFPAGVNGFFRASASSGG